MTYVPQINRRAFVASAAAFGGGFALGMELPFSPNVVRAAEGAPEVTAWVVIKPDDSVVIRIARSEMGQGSMTGLAQLVAEELERSSASSCRRAGSGAASASQRSSWPLRPCSTRSSRLPDSESDHSR